MRKSMSALIREALQKDPNFTTQEAYKLTGCSNVNVVRNLMYRERHGLNSNCKPNRTRQTKTEEIPVKPQDQKIPERESELIDDRVARGNEFWEDRYGTLHKKYEDALKELVLVDRLVNMARQVAPISYNQAPDLTPMIRGEGHPQSAVLLLSDTHIGKVVDPGQTLYFGNYNFTIFLQRLKHLETRIISILLDHTSTKLNKLVIAMLGDMVDGALAHAAECATINTRFTQVYMGAHAVAQFIRNISAYVPAIEIVTVVGNHGRWADQHKMPTKNRFSNLDMFFYAQVQALLSGIPKVKFELDSQPFKTMMVENTFIWFGHGDHLKGGDKAMGIPAHSIGRQLSSVSQMFSKAGRQVPNIYCIGDKHKRMELPHAMGDFLVNGAFPGYDEYAHSSNFTDTGPDQKLFLLHPKYGRSASYNISLANAQEIAKPYDLPTGFTIV